MYTYTAVQLQAKTFGELKSIARELDIVPSGDRRCRQNWIDAIAGVNQALLALLEVSPGAQVESISELPIEVQAQTLDKEQFATDSFAPAIEYLKSVLHEPLGAPFIPRDTRLDCPFCGAIHALFADSDYSEMLNRTVIRCLHCLYVRPKNYPGPIQIEVTEPIEVQRQEPIELEACKPQIGQLMLDVAQIPEKILSKKSFRDLKAIAFELGVLPQGNHRFRQSWIDALDGVLFPAEYTLSSVLADEVHVLELLPEPVRNSLAPKFDFFCQFLKNSFNDEQPPNRGDNGRDRRERAIVIAAENLTPGKVDAELAAVDAERFRPEGAGIYHQRIDTAESGGDSSSIEFETLGSQKCDRVLAPARDSQRDKGRALPDRSDELTAIVKDLTAHSLSELLDSLVRVLDSIDSPGVTFSSRFLALYSPPQSESIHYKSDGNGQLSLLDFEVELVDEPPDFDDFDGNMFAFWAAYDAWHEAHPGDDCEHCEFSSRHCEPIELSPPSMCIDAQAGEMPDTNEIIETSSITLEISPVADFFIPTFDGFADRSNRSDEPPLAGVGGRFPKPNPPSFPPVMVAAGDRPSSVKKFARCAIPSSGRAPPGGDAGQSA